MNAGLGRLFIRACGNINRFRAESAIRLFCIMTGAASVIASVDYAASGRAEILRQLRNFGTDLVTIIPQQSARIAGRARTGRIVTTLVNRDLSFLKRNVSGFIESAAIYTAVYPAKAGDNNKTGLTVVGCSPAYFAMRRWQVSAGAFLDRQDERRLSRYAVVGAKLANDLFGGEPPIGKTILINRIRFEVKGVLEEHGQGRDAANEDEEAFIPLSTAMKRLSNVDYFSGIVLQVREASFDRAQIDAEVAMSHLHRPLLREREDFQIQSAIAILAAQQAANQRLGFIVRLSGAGCFLLLTAGSLCITWLTVTHRMPELGILRLIGASRSDILAQIAFEFSLIAMGGCVLGLPLALGSFKVLALRNGLQPAIDWNAMIETFLAAALLNLIFAVFPALRAARSNPIEVLRL